MYIFLKQPEVFIVISKSLLGLVAVDIVVYLNWWLNVTNMFIRHYSNLKIIISNRILIFYFIKLLQKSSAKKTALKTADKRFSLIRQSIWQENSFCLQKQFTGQLSSKGRAQTTLRLLWEWATSVGLVWIWWDHRIANSTLWIFLIPCKTYPLHKEWP